MARLLVVLALVSCAAPADPEPKSGAVPGRGAAYSMNHPPPAITAAAAKMVGSCAFARPPGELSDYDKSIEAKRGAAVYASAAFDVGKGNRIGELPAGPVRAAGPVAEARGRGFGYAVLVVDGTGRACRGYVESEPTNRARGRSM